MQFLEIDELELRIEQLRNKMIETAAVTGLSSNITLYYSQKLDQLITIYQNTLKKETSEILMNRNKAV
ncbi:aspartyl-phosphate phosphatase Spo0E family protein [Niallia endozanthoxylica]|uniref:Aspartyl-phosphate phosphatase Spo0E family protein n=1 Tax=Niallia endozanthoxylica TaxID=2036016 RepID=A0A5J5HRG1_9BACI|nr:aspartyl-phosphate phosphatase Spo0E family protein [Niallia endozanthoxylica]KAA9022597.1 aspartyl-phosphate phosphatase Spo0E family protein [Niallia endozanthoxylica]